MLAGDVMHTVLRREFVIALRLDVVAGRLIRAPEARKKRTHELDGAAVPLGMFEREQVPAQSLAWLGFEMRDVVRSHPCVVVVRASLPRCQKKAAGIVEPALKLGLGTLYAEKSRSAVEIHVQARPLAW